MKEDTKDWLKKTAGTSALIASPGILAATAIGGPLAGLAVGGAVAGGNIIGSLAYKTGKDIVEDIKNRRKFRELQRHVLAENGILHYQPIVPVANDMSSHPALDKIAKKNIEEELREYELEKKLEYEKAKIDKKYLNKLNLGDNLKSILLRGFGTGDFALTKLVGSVIYPTKVGQAIDKAITIADNVGEGVIVRNGHTVRGDFKHATGFSDNIKDDFNKVVGFSEDSLLSVDEDELNHMMYDIVETDNPEERDLKKSRYLSILTEASRKKLLDLLAERNRENGEAHCDPITTFSEFSSLNKIAEGRDFGVLGALTTAFRVFAKGSKVAKATKVADAMAGAASNVEKVSSGEGIISKVAKGIGKATKDIKDNFNLGSGKKVAENIANNAKKAAEKGAEVAEKAVEKGVQPNLPGFEEPKVPEPSKVPEPPKTKYAEIQSRINEGGSVNKAELKGLQMAGKSQAAAKIGETIGYENLGKLNTTVKAVATKEAIEQSEKRRNQQQGA